LEEVTEMNEGSDFYSIIADEDINKQKQMSICGYDGASVMSGSNNSVQVKVCELAKNSCPYIRC